MSTPRRSSRASTPTLDGRNLVGNVSAANRRSKRPLLPLAAFNKIMNPKRVLHSVKIQTLRLGDSQTIVIARVKCPIPRGCPGHIIKRFDTDAVSASSLFRAAFPTATAEEEETEMEWISNSSRQRYGNTHKAGAEDTDASKLSGTWIPTAHALELAIEYDIERYATDLIAFPDPAKINLEDSPASEPAPEPARTKRQRVLSPPAVSKATPSMVEVTQTVEVVLKSIETETMEVETISELETTLDSHQSVVDESSEESARGLAQVAESKALVELLKLQQADKIEKASLKRAIEHVDTEDEFAVAPVTLHDVLVPDNRGMMGKLFRRAPAGSRRTPVNAGREIKAAGSQLALLEREEENVRPERRRWIAGVGLVLAIGATAAAPYLLG